MNYKTTKFIDGDFELEINAPYIDNQCWLSQEQLASLFERHRSVVARHIRNIFETEQCAKTESNVRFLHIPKSNKAVSFYSLEVALSLGYRIKSNRAVLLKDQLDKTPYDGENLSNLIIYNNGSFNIAVNVSPEEETVWLAQKEIAELFETTQQNVSLHIRNILQDGEIDSSVHKDSLYTAIDGKRYLVSLYNLDMILAVGYRIKSKRATEFRRWSSNVLKQYLFKGYVIDKERASISKENFDQLKDEMRNIKNDIQDLKEKAFLTSPKEKLFFNGEYFDAYEFLCSLVSKSQRTVVVIDPYFDAKGLTILRKTSPNVKRFVCITKKANLNEKDVQTFEKQYGTVNVLSNKHFHDRFLIIDGEECYSLGTSLNYPGKKIFAIIKMEDETIIETLYRRISMKKEDY